MIRTSLALAALLLLTACADGGAGGPDLAGEWELVGGVADGAALPMPAGRRATLLFEDGTLGGRSFCNHYSGSYQADDDGLHIAGLGGTEMGCEPAVMHAESRFMAALAAASRTSVEDGDLVLTGDDVELRFRPVPPVPASALVGTRWALDTLIDGDTASSPLGDPAGLHLDPDGTFTASTGCRSLTGTWVADGGTVGFPDMAAQGECPEDIARQDDHVVAVLGDGFAVAIDGDRLTVTAPDGRGLRYRAE